MEEKSLASIVRKAEQDYISGTTTHSRYVQLNQYDRINKIDAYINSKHISGDTDAMGRDKPFFNIVTAARNIWYRATDIDRKNIKVRATKASDYLMAFIATLKLQDWMRREAFGTFLNDWGRALATYGSCVLKFVEQEGKLIPNVISWQRVIVDTIDFENNIKIEMIEVTEAQLMQRKGYDKEQVEKLCETRSARKDLNNQQKDNKADYIKLYEVHGMLPLSYLTDNDEDDDTYVQQMHVLSFVAGKDKGEFDDFTLVSGKEEKDPYMITHLIREDGQTLSIGAVEHLFEAQWMINHSVKAIKDQLDLASKLIFQTSDGNFVGQNALSAIENGDILVHAVNQPLTQVANSSHDITSLQNFGSQWKALAQEITSTPDAMMGNTAPSGTAWRQVEALQQEAHSLFELMTENKGLDIENMLRTYVIPHIKKGLKNKDELSAILASHDIDKIDAKYVKNTATAKTNSDLVDSAIKFISGESDQAPTPEIQAAMQTKNEGEVKSSLSELGNQRFFKPSEADDKTWSDIFKDLEWELEIDVTGEQAFNKEDLATLSTVMQTIAGNPMVLQDPNAKMLFNAILTKTGVVSPLEIAQIPPAPQPVQAPTAPPSAIGGGLPTNV